MLGGLTNRQVEDFRGFITYITSVWGLLTGLTAVFPTTDVILKVIPLPVDAYEKSAAPITIPITTPVALYIVFYSFVRCDRVALKLSRQASLFFILGLISLIVFFLLDHFEYPLRTRLFPSLNSGDDYILMLVGMVPFLRDVLWLRHARIRDLGANRVSVPLFWKSASVIPLSALSMTL